MKILHFHRQILWSSIVYHSVANVNRHLYVLVFYSHNSSIVLSFKLLLLWFFIHFFCYLRQTLCLKWSLKSAYLPKWLIKRGDTWVFYDKLCTIALEEIWLIHSRNWRLPCSENSLPRQLSWLELHFLH